MELEWSKTPLIGKISFCFILSLFLIPLIAIYTKTGGILIFLGFYFFNIIILIKTIMNANNIRNPKSTQGVVVGEIDSLHNIDIEKQMKSPQSLTYNNIVEYLVDGKTYQTSTTFSRGGILRRKNGDFVTVVYNELNLENAEIVGDRKNSNRVLAVLFSVGIILIIVGVIIIMI